MRGKHGAGIGHIVKDYTWDILMAYQRIGRIGSGVHYCLQLHFWLQLPINEHPGRQQVATQDLGPYHRGSLSGPVWTPAVVDIWGVSQCIKDLALSVSVYLSAFKENK